MKDCIYLDQCPIWGTFGGRLQFVWINTYCKGARQNDCARKILKLQGHDVSQNLLPNGEQLHDSVMETVHEA